MQPARTDRELQTEAVINGFDGDITTIRNFMTDLVEHVAPYFTSVYSNTELAEALDFHRRYTNTNEFEDEADDLQVAKDNDGPDTRRADMQAQLRRVLHLVQDEVEAGANDEEAALYVMLAASAMLDFDYAEGLVNVLLYTAKAAYCSDGYAAETAECRWQVCHFWRTVDFIGCRVQL